MTHEGAAPQQDVPEEYLDMVMTCPDPKGKEAGAQTLRTVLESERGEKMRPQIIENIANVERLKETGFSPEEAAVIAFGGAIVTNETGEIVRQPDPETAEALAQTQPQLAEAEKK